MLRFKHRKRGAGTIIGAAFLVLILMTGFTYYLMYFDTFNEYTETVRDIQETDLERSEESIEYKSVSKTSGNQLNITARNKGPYQVHLIWIGVYNETENSQEYYGVNYYIEPLETVTNIRNDTIRVNDIDECVIQLVTELGNVYEYSPSEESGEVSQSHVTISGTIEDVYNATQWNLLGSTQNVSGSITDLSSNDANYAVFRSYLSGAGTDTEDYVDNNTSNVDSSPDKGTHSNFTAQQYGPEGTFDTLTEENVTLIGVLKPPVFQSFTEAGSSGDVFQIQVNKPSGTVQGDLLFAVFSKDATDGVLSSPSGWTDLGETSTGGSRVLFSYKIATSSEPATYTFTSTDSDQMVVGVARFSGVNQSDPVDVYSSINTGTSNTPVSPSVTTNIANTTILRAMGADDDDVIAGSNYPPGHTGIFTVQSTGGFGETHGALANMTQINPGPTGTADFSMTQNEQWGAITIALKPSSITSSFKLDLEAQWTNADYDESNEELAIYLHTENSHTLDATGGYMVVGDGTPDWGSTRGAISFWIKWDTVGDRPWGQNDNMEMRFSGSNIVLDWGNTDSLTSSTIFVTGQWYFVAVTWNEASDDLYLYVGDENNTPIVDASNTNWLDMVSSIGVTENNFLASRGGVDPTAGHGDDLRYYNIDRSLGDLQGDYKIELTGSESNLRSYFRLNNDFDDIGPDNNDGSGSGSYSFSGDVPFGVSSEDIRVDVWYGSTWQNLFTDLTSGWNNVSVSAFLDSSIFTIRFKDGTDTGDAAPDVWNIDAVLLHVWSVGNQYTSEVEFVGSSNLQAWTKIDWKIDSNWDIGEVAVTIQFYDYVLDDYVSSGEGFYSYDSDINPNTDELVSQTISSNPTKFRGSAGTWKVKVTGVKYAVSQFLMRVDWIEFKTSTLSLGDESIPFDTWRLYEISATTPNGEPIPYAYTSISANGTNISMRNALTNVSLTNPDWIYLDANGLYYLELKSANPTSETFILKVVVGSIVGEKTIDQEAP